MGYSPNTFLETDTIHICIYIKHSVVSCSFLNFQLLKLIILRWDAAQGIFVIILFNFYFFFIKLIRQCMFVAYIKYCAKLGHGLCTLHDLSYIYCIITEGRAFVLTRYDFKYATISLY